MQERETMKHPTQEQGQCCGRERCPAVLRNEARRLIENAAQLNKLADAIEHLDGDAEATLHSILFRGLRT